MCVRADCVNFTGIFYGVACPSNASYCCGYDTQTPGACVGDVSQCSCSSSSDCPFGSCCSAGTTALALVYVLPSKDTEQHACPKCTYSTLCPRIGCGTCGWLELPTQPACHWNAGTQQCTSSAFMGGVQVCTDCFNLLDQGMECGTPGNETYCCGQWGQATDGQCVSDPSQCGCSYAGQCDRGFCCNERERPCMLLLFMHLPVG